MGRILFPKPLAGNSQPSKEDVDYAQHFTDIAHLLDGLGNAEQMALRLSTCRNVYLTLNSLFVDLAEILGHGSTPSLLCSAVEYLRQSRLQETDKALGQIGLRLAQYKLKREVWDRRQILDDELQSALEKMDRLAAARITRALTNVRTGPEAGSPAEAGWDRRWVEISREEGAWATERLGKLDQSDQILHAVATAIRAITDFWRKSEPVLFPDPGDTLENRWGVLYQQLRDHAGALSLVVSPGEAEHLSWYLSGEENCQLLRRFTSTDDATVRLGQLISHLQRLEQTVYKELAGSFRPNVGRPPLPPPYRIDVTDAFSVRTPDIDLKDTLALVSARTYGKTPPAKINVALCNFGVPAIYYDDRLHRYLDESRRREITTIAKAAVETASVEKASVLVLPELFLPASSLNEIAELARNKGIALISGVEPTEAEGTHRLDNQAIIALPSLSWVIEQKKRRNSPYEHVFRYENAAVYVLGGTEIGAFAVLVCSDLREFDVVAAIAGARFCIDTLFVCSFNPHPELFHNFAVTDSARLYCHVVIANNSSASGNALASSNGTLICSPILDPGKRVRTPSHSKEIGLPDIGGKRPTLTFTELGIEELRTEREKPEKGYMNCPYFRRSKPFA